MTFESFGAEGALEILLSWSEDEEGNMINVSEIEVPEPYSMLGKVYSIEGVPNMSAERLISLYDWMKENGYSFIFHPMMYRGKTEYRILVFQGSIMDFASGFLKAAEEDSTERWEGYSAYFNQFEVVGEDDELDEQLEDIMACEFEISKIVKSQRQNGMKPAYYQKIAFIEKERPNLYERGAVCQLIVKTPAFVGPVDQSIQILNDIMDYVFGAYFVTFDLAGIERTNKDW